MSVLILLIAAGGTVAFGFLIAFVWAVRSGQFDDLWTPAVRMLLDARRAAARAGDDPVLRQHSSPPISDRHTG